MKRLLLAAAMTAGLATAAHADSAGWFLVNKPPYERCDPVENFGPEAGFPEIQHDPASIGSMLFERRFVVLLDKKSNSTYVILHVIPPGGDMQTLFFIHGRVTCQIMLSQFGLG